MDFSAWNELNNELKQQEIWSLTSYCCIAKQWFHIIHLIDKKRSAHETVKSDLNLAFLINLKMLFHFIPDIFSLLVLSHQQF